MASIWGLFCFFRGFLIYVSKKSIEISFKLFMEVFGMRTINKKRRIIEIILIVLACTLPTLLLSGCAFSGVIRICKHCAFIF